jgi:hypothetical protein
MLPPTPLINPAPPLARHQQTFVNNQAFTAARLNNTFLAVALKFATVPVDTSPNFSCTSMLQAFSSQLSSNRQK